MTNLSKVNRVLTDKQRAFLSFLADEAKGDIRSAMTMAGYSKDTRQDEVYKSLTDEILVIAKELLAKNSIKASIKLANVLDNPGDIGQDKVISAAKEILDRAGVFKREQNETTIQADTIFILPAKDGVIAVDNQPEEA